jgi:hypothetical protein
MVGKRVTRPQGTQRRAPETQHRLDEDAGGKTRYVAAALRKLLSSDDATSHAKASAARTLAEMAGAIGRHQLAPVDRAQEARVSLLKRDELERELARLRTICAGDKPLSP